MAKKSSLLAPDRLSFPLETHDRKRILVVDDESPIRSLLREYLEKLGYQVFIADSARTGLTVFKQVQPQVVISDIRMEGPTGISLLGDLKRLDPSLPVIMITGYPSVDSAIEALQEEAFDYLIKPFNLAELEEKIKAALDIRRLSRDNIILKEMASLHQVTSFLASTQSMDSLLAFTMEQSLKLSHAEAGSLLLVDREAASLVTVGSFGTKENTKISPLANAQEWAPAKWAVKNKRSLLIQDGRTFPEGADVPLDQNEAASFVSIPLMAADHVVGVLNLSRKKKELAEKDLQVVSVLASQVGVAIENVRLYESLKLQLQHLTFVSEYSETLMGKIERKDVYEHFFATVRDKFRSCVDLAAVLIEGVPGPEMIYWCRFHASPGALTQAHAILLESMPQEKKTAGPAVIPFVSYAKPDNSSGRRTIEEVGEHLVVPLVGHEGTFGAALIAVRSGATLSMGFRELIASLIGQTCIAAANSRLYEEMKENYFKTIKALALAVDAKDTYTGGHSELVSKYAASVASELRMGEKNVTDILNAGLLHDVGKIGIPGHILNKPGLLTTEEFNSVMKSHSALGANIVKEVPFLRHLAPLILYHHEWYDGGGYPEGLVGEAIPIGARILCVADAYAAMVCDRPYRKSLGKAEACRRIWESRGQQFDADIADIFLGLVAKEK